MSMAAVSCMSANSFVTSARQSAAWLKDLDHVVPKVEDVFLVLNCDRRWKPS